MRRVLVEITGIVQGVGFRAWTADAARDRGLYGWVRNRRDGSVEALFCGGDSAVGAMLELCKAGPRGAEVSAVAIRDWSEEAPIRFEILPTK